MAEFEYAVNPPLPLIDEIDNEMFVTNGWSRVQKTMEISYEAFDLFVVILAIEKKTQQPVGIISVAKDYSLDGSRDDVVLYVGSFYVRADHRLKGIGKQLGTMALVYGKGANIVMNGTLELVEQYKQAGFIHCREYKNAFFTIETKDIQLKEVDDDRIKDIGEVDFNLVHDYDNTICTRERRKYLELWLTRPPGNATKVHLNESTNKVDGFICINPQHANRLVVGPFYAETENIAEVLLHSALSQFDLTKYECIIFKFPETNEGMKRILSSICTIPVEIVAKGIAMFTEKVIPTEPNKIYGVTETAHSYL